MGLVLVALALLTQDAREWVKVSTSTSGSIFSVRSKDIANEANLNPIVWVEIDYSRDRRVAHRSSKRRFAIDCSAATYQMLANIDYDAQGVVVNSSNTTANQYSHQPIAPETVTEDLAKAVCPTGKYAG